MKFNKILIANRGEIALRIMRSAKEMGLQTVAVYSEADRNAPFVRFADQAVLLGPPPSNQSYLLMDKVIEAAKTTGAQAIHPGYGFLSENAEFARRVSAAGLVFVGPSPESMEVMGSKLGAKDAVVKFNVPLVPGSEGAIDNIDQAIKVAQQVGFPILIKASAGGGGKGMRIVEQESELQEQMTLAINEALSAFGDGAVFIERYVGSPRHIEIQVLGDTHGNVVYLFERECSVQRRHQKVVEEAPSAVLTPELRKAMGEAAVMVARACNYIGAGTVEFLLDEKLNFYFLEMNTRLQVEHPVTEMITGKDLVKEQILVAQGLPLSFKQEDLSINGHSIEVRVYAEDPTNNFLPDIGTLEVYKAPQGPGVRVDDGFEEGMQIPIYYDPMISKLIVHASDREQAMDRMIRAIDEYKVKGVQTTLSFCKFVMEHEAFRSGNFDTHFVKSHFEPSMLNEVGADAEELKISALVAGLIFQGNSNKSKAEAVSNSGVASKWKKNRLA